MLIISLVIILSIDLLILKAQQKIIYQFSISEYSISPIEKPYNSIDDCLSDSIFTR